MQKMKWWRWEIKLLIIILVIIFSGEYTCPIKKYFGIGCPSCGLTRALKSLIHFRFRESFFYHPLLILIIPAIFFGVNAEKFPRQKKFINVYLIMTSILFVIVYLIRLHTNSIP